MDYSIYAAHRRKSPFFYGDERSQMITISLDPKVIWKAKDVCRDKELKISRVINTLLSKWLEEQDIQNDKYL